MPGLEAFALRSPQQSLAVGSFAGLQVFAADPFGGEWFLVHGGQNRKSDEPGVNLRRDFGLFLMLEPTSTLPDDGSRPMPLNALEPVWFRAMIVAAGCDRRRANDCV